MATAAAAAVGLLHGLMVDAACSVSPVLFSTTRTKTRIEISTNLKLSARRNETETKRFRNCFETVSFRFHFNYADSFRMDVQDRPKSLI